ncbi:Pectate lyase-like protein 8 [Elsinoe fawcettii]|nr:Pectate lyase-like protein 8 [Elsinoe fawcettii]
MKYSITFTAALLSATVAAQAPLYGQCGGINWTGSTSCVSGATCVSSSEFYSQCLPSGSGGAATTLRSSTTKTTKTSSTKTSTTKTTKTTTTKAAATSGSGGGNPPPSGVTTIFPAASGETAAASPILVAAGASFDGGMKRFSRNPDTCQEQKETDEAAAMFILEDGAKISNAILSKAQAEGIHCRGACTISNVWWEDVCEDAATFKQAAGSTSYVVGGGARGAADKIFQFNGRGTVSIKNFYAEDYGKVLRSCGDCTANGGPRNVIIENVVAKDGGPLCGINSNFGDTCRISNSCQDSGKSCDRYKGV